MAPTVTATFQLPLPRTPAALSFEAPVRRDSSVQLYAMIRGTDSYGGVSRSLARALVDARVDVSLCDYTAGGMGDDSLATHEGLNRDAAVGLFHGFPEHAPEWFFNHRITIGLFVCEADRILPQWVRACNRFDLVVVPSSFCRGVFIDSGVTCPIMVVPHGVDPVFHPRPGGRGDGRFVFFNTFRHRVHDRKGYIELLRCYRRAFAGRDDVLLRIDTDDHRWLPKPVELIGGNPQVEFLPPGHVDPETMAQRFADAHCTVHPSKGEGFGLVPLESIACATPVIAPAHSGMADYLDERNAILLRPGAKIRAPRIHHLCGHFTGVDEAHLVERLRHTMEQWPAEHARVCRASAGLRERYAWPAVLASFIDLVRTAAESGDRGAFAESTMPFLDERAIVEAFDAAGRRARAAASPANPGAAVTARFPSVVFCGFDHPRDSIGRHLRLLDEMVFSVPGIRYKSLEELGRAADPAADPPAAPFVHEQRPDLFRRCLFIDVVGVHGDRNGIARQVARVRGFRERFDARTVIYLMWESDRLWEPMRELLRAHDLTIVTSNLLAEDLERHGIAFTMLPHPYRYAVQRPRKTPTRTPEPLVVGISAGFWSRKNLALAAETFADVLGGDSRYRLRLHTRMRPNDPAERAEHHRIEEAMTRSGNIELTMASLSREHYLQWMRSLDVYCCLSSGEGWSVTPREALHLGKPVIVLDAHVHAGFSHLPGVIPVAAGTPREASHGLKWVDGDVGHEAGVDREALAAVLRDLPRHWRQQCLALRARFGEVIDHHDPDKTRARWIEVLNALCGSAA